MASQKDMKKRLKALMSLPENQVCSDCTERQPRWASLVVPPPDAPAGTPAMGAFCCLECSGSHRRLGVHISFVRSINLDSWKEKEVLAMEMGGNARVNLIFEARLPPSSGQKPTNHADGPTRERFIRDKYERRKFYDPQAYSRLSDMVSAVPTRNGSANNSNNNSSNSSVHSAPPVVSEAARQRLEARNAAGRQPKKSTSDLAASNDDFDKLPVRRTGSMRGNRRNIAKAPASAPLNNAPDLLDMDAFNTASNNNSSNTNNFNSSSNNFDAESRDGSGTSKGSRRGNTPKSKSGRLSRTSSKDNDDFPVSSGSADNDWLQDFASTPAADPFGGSSGNGNTNNNAQGNKSHNIDIMSLYSSGAAPQPQGNNAFGSFGGGGGGMPMMSNSNGMPMMNGGQSNMPNNMALDPNMMASFMNNPQMVAQMTAMMQNMNFGNMQQQSGGFPSANGGAFPMNAQQSNISMNFGNGGGGGASNSSGNAQQPQHLSQNTTTANAFQSWMSSGVDGFGGAVPQQQNQQQLQQPQSQQQSQSNKSNKKNKEPDNDPFAQFGMNVFRS